MDKLVIQGKRKLQGRVSASGSKNAALPILISTLLADGKVDIARVPELQDIRTTLKVLEMLGVKVTRDAATASVRLDATQIISQEAPYDLVRTMRASVLVLGPLLARFGRAKVSLPGGCAIGARPIDYHLSGLEKLGAKIELDGGYVIATAKRLVGARVRFEFPSVGATENLMMAASLAKGTTRLENCAREPEIIDLAATLRRMGAVIQGEGTETIEIEGQASLASCQTEVMGDRIEAGTFLAAGLITGGDVTVEGISPETLEAALVKFEEMGARIERKPTSIRLVANGEIKPVDLKTLPYPGFPTDMQAQFMSVLALASGTSVITETIFENRFMHVPELIRLGADIQITGNAAVVKGVRELKGAPVMATDLRASASLVLAGLAASGQTEILRVYHLDRGYEKMETKLSALGALIERH